MYNRCSVNCVKATGKIAERAKIRTHAQISFGAEVILINQTYSIFYAQSHLSWDGGVVWCTEQGTKRNQLA